MALTAALSPSNLPQSSTGLADFRECTAHRDERVVAMDMLYRHGQLSQALIGKIMGGLDYTTVSRERKRLR